MSAEAQYRPPIDPTPVYQPIQWLESPRINHGDYPILEVYLTNHRDHPIELTRFLLNNKQIAEFPRGEVVWRQYYPTAIVRPGKTALLQICLLHKPRTSQKLAIRLKSAEWLTFDLPAYTASEHTITGVAFDSEFHSIYMTYVSTARRRPTPCKEAVNGKDLTAMSRVLSAPNDKLPGMVVTRLPEPVTLGGAVWIRLGFPDAKTAQCMLRASNGFMLDAFAVDAKDEKLRTELGLDVHPLAVLNQSDPVCIDKGRFGYSAPAILDGRATLLAADPARLSYIFMCGRAHPSLTYSIYGQCVDSLAVNPFALWNCSMTEDFRFLDEEENFFRWGLLAARPRPWLWIPEAWVLHSANTPRSRLRMIEPEELRSLAYAAVGHGVKGFSYFTYDSGKEYTGFQKSEALTREIKNLNAELRSIAPLLSQALPLSVETVSLSGKGARVYTLWAGADGLLVVLRNLDYTTSKQANDLGNAPRFRCMPARHVTLHLDKPAWLHLAKVVDVTPEGQQSFSYRANGTSLELEIDGLALTKMMWLKNGSRDIRGWSTRKNERPGGALLENMKGKSQ